MEKCFVLYSAMDSKSIPGTVSNTKILFDGFEGQEYGSYVSLADKKKTGEASSLECHVLSATGVKTACKSEEEFNALANFYLESPWKQGGRPK
jgi:hypothetical protein